MILFIGHTKKTLLSLPLGIMVLSIFILFNNDLIAQNEDEEYEDVEYEDEEDAEHAIYNMDGAELFDHTIFVKTATKLKGFDSNKAAWEDENFNVGQGEAGEAGEEDGDQMEAS